MNDYLIYLCLPPYLAQWYAHECNQVHNRDKDVCPREIYRFPTPVVPVRNSQESEAYIRTFISSSFLRLSLLGRSLHSPADHSLQSYVGRALQGFTSSALVPNTVALPIPNAFFLSKCRNMDELGRKTCICRKNVVTLQADFIHGSGIEICR